MIKVALTIGDDGKPALEGPIDNKILTLGLLELAKECLLEYHRNKAAGNESRIVRPTFGGPSGIV